MANADPAVLFQDAADLLPPAAALLRRARQVRIALHDLGSCSAANEAERVVHGATAQAIEQGLLLALETVLRELKSAEQRAGGSWGVLVMVPLPEGRVTSRF